MAVEPELVDQRPVDHQSEPFFGHFSVQQSYFRGCQAKNVQEDRQFNAIARHSSRPSDEASAFEERIIGELIVELSRAKRSMIMNHLIRVKDCVLFDSLITGKTKK